MKMAILDKGKINKYNRSFILFDFNKALCCLVVFLIFHCRVQNTSRKGVKI